MRERKYDYLYVVQGWYHASEGWEDLTASKDRREALANLYDYHRNDQYAQELRMVTRRIRREQP